MLFRLAPEGVMPLNSEARICSRTPAEIAFIAAGLCTDEYLDTVNGNGVGSAKADLHRHETKGAEPLIINPSFNGVAPPHLGIKQAINSVRDVELI